MATIRKLRSGRYQSVVRRAGYPTVSKTFALRKDADAWGREQDRKADTGRLIDQSELRRTSLGELVERYLSETIPNKRRGEVERTYLLAFLRHPISDKKLSEISPNCFARYRDERLKSIQSESLKRQLSPIKNMFEIARKEWGYPIDNPLSAVAITGPPGKRERRLRVGELTKLLNAAGDRSNGFVARAIIFAIETGMRRGEVLSIRWEHVDFTEPSLLVPHTDAKNGHARIVPLTKRAVLMLTPSSAERPFPLTANAFKLAWQKVVARAGIDDLHFHDLRHEALSRYFEKGLTVPEVALISGHRDYRMLARYTHPQRKLIAAKLSS